MAHDHAHSDGYVRLAQKYNLKNLDWFFSQWVHQSYLPSYRIEYRLEDQPDGSAIVRGTVYQENAGENRFMPLPLLFRFGNDQAARGAIYAFGPETSFQVRLPRRPEKVELDPEEWILPEKTDVHKSGNNPIVSRR